MLDAGPALDAVVGSLVGDVGLTGRLGDPARRANVSAILPTYNRCPFGQADHDVRDNPLTWAIDSLQAQEGEVLAEIIVAVDPRTTDHTLQVVAECYREPAQGAKVPVRVVHVNSPGLAATRNAGVFAARTEWVLFGDDDCVFAPHYAAGAAYAAHVLKARDRSLAAVMLPFYYRSLGPHDVVPVEQIGRLRPAEALFSTRFHTWPRSYLPVPDLLDESGLVAPFEVQLIGGTALMDRERLVAVGGFRNLPGWQASYSEHLHLSADLTDSGGTLYHCPDPRLAAVHLKFGAAGRFALHEPELAREVFGLRRTLGELVEIASEPRTGTGCRIPDGRFHAEMLGSFFAFFAGRSLIGGVEWARRTWQEFVLEGEVYSQTVTRQLARIEREEAWHQGIADGVRALACGTASGPTSVEVSALLDAIAEATGQVHIKQW